MFQKCLDNKYIRLGVAAVLGTFLGWSIQGGYEAYKSIKYFTERNAPVLQNVEIIDHKINGKMYEIHIVGEKVRKDCGAPLKIDGYYGNPLIPFDFVEVKSKMGKNEPYKERPALPGKQQDFGYWVMMPIPDSEFYLYVDYLCGQDTGAPYNHRVILGPFEVKK